MSTNTTETNHLIPFRINKITHINATAPGYVSRTALEQLSVATKIKQNKKCTSSIRFLLLLHVYHSPFWPPYSYFAAKRKTKIIFQINNKLGRCTCESIFDIWKHIATSSMCAKSIVIVERIWASRYTNTIFGISMRKLKCDIYVCVSTYSGLFNTNPSRNNKNSNNSHCKYMNYVFDSKIKSSLCFGVQRTSTKLWEKAKYHNMWTKFCGNSKQDVGRETEDKVGTKMNAILCCAWNGWLVGWLVCS